jgi:hypothetical protein
MLRLSPPIQANPSPDPCYKPATFQTQRSRFVENMDPSTLHENNISVLDFAYTGRNILSQAAPEVMSTSAVECKDKAEEKETIRESFLSALKKIVRRPEGQNGSNSKPAKDSVETHSSGPKDTRKAVESQSLPGEPHRNPDATRRNHFARRKINKFFNKNNIGDRLTNTSIASAPTAGDTEIKEELSVPDSVPDLGRNTESTLDNILEVEAQETPFRLMQQFPTRFFRSSSRRSRSASILSTLSVTTIAASEHIIILESNFRQPIIRDSLEILREKRHRCLLDDMNAHHATEPHHRLEFITVPQSIPVHSKQTRCSCQCDACRKFSNGLAGKFKAMLHWKRTGKEQENSDAQKKKEKSREKKLSKRKIPDIDLETRKQLGLRGWISFP